VEFVAYEFLLTVPTQLRDVVLVDPSAGDGDGSDPQASDSPQQETQLSKEEQEALQRVLNNLVEVANELQAQEYQRLEEMQQVAVELAVAIASHVVHERIDAGDYAVEALVRKAAAGLKTAQPITIYLHPLDLELLEKRLAKMQPPAPDLTKLRFVGDALLGRGDCRAEAGEMGVLSQMQEHLAGLRKQLLETLPEALLDRRRSLPTARRLRRFPDRRHTA
jgi:flagellar biosynthesis/type III secretory pathway protein FliH